MIEARERTRITKARHAEGGIVVPDAIARIDTPEELEYARYLGEVESRRRRIADLEAELQALKETLGRFSAEYHTRVGKLFAELDRIELEIAECEYRILRLQRKPDLDPEDLDRETHEHFSRQREQVHEEEEQTRRYERAYIEEQQRPRLDAPTEALLKSLFRDLAKQFHPDLARTVAERQYREIIMKRINEAFHNRDIAALQSISADAAFEDAAYDEKTIGEKLVWAIREVSRLDALITSITEERGALIKSELGQLWQRQESGENIIERIEREVRGDIDAARERLNQLLGVSQ